MTENSSSHTFQTFWWGDALSPYEMFCLKSFIDHGHKVHLYTFEPQLDVPEGVLTYDASKVIGRDRFFTYESGDGKGSPAGFANLFRYRLLAEKGGWWIDTDVVCLSSKIPIVDQFFAYQDDKFVNNAVLFFEAQHDVMIRCHSQAEKLGSSVKFGVTGPRLLTQVLGELGYIDRAYPPSVCYPVHYSRALDLLRPSEATAVLQCIQSSLFLHLWNVRVRRDGIQKEYLPPRGSVLRELVERHQVLGWTAEYDSKTLECLHLNAEIQRQKKMLESILSSRSWRWTAPMRSIMRLCQSLHR
jgi:hypothetical protein